jgi:hypothetical protein
MVVAPHMARTSGGTAVMARRRDPLDSLDFYPTPPWATRALFEHVLPAAGAPHICSAWEPACGEGHMAAVIEEYVAIVKATDVFDYGYAPICQSEPVTADFLDQGTRVEPAPDFIITNPPFAIADQFALLAFERAAGGVALLLRTTWLESVPRYKRIFRDRPPTLFAPFVERVPMVKGRWDPDASSATSYAWFVWVHGEAPKPPFWIPPDCRRALTKRDDVRRFAPLAEAPLLEGAA